MEKIKGKIRFHYDKKGDILYSYINKPRKAKCIEYENGILIRVDPKTNKIVGFTAIGYEKRKKDGLLKNIPHFENLALPSFK